MCPDDNEQCHAVHAVAQAGQVEAVKAKLHNRKLAVGDARLSDHPVDKMNKVLAILQLDNVLLEQLVEESRERHEQSMSEVSNVKIYFAAEVNAISKKLDTVNSRLDTMASKDDIAGLKNEFDRLRKETQEAQSLLREEIQINHQEISEKLLALLNK